MDKKFTKLSELVDDSFTINKVWGYQWKLWDNANKKMLVSDKWEKDYKKIYSVDTNKGSLDLSASQLGQILELFHKNGSSDIVGATINVKSNGKTGMEIRYFFNPDYNADRVVEADNTSDEAEVTKEELDALGW